MHVPNALTLIQRTGTYSPTLNTLRARYDQMIIIFKFLIRFLNSQEH